MLTLLPPGASVFPKHMSSFGLHYKACVKIQEYWIVFL